MQLREFQDVIARTYLERDAARGVAGDDRVARGRGRRARVGGAQGLSRRAGARDGRRARLAGLARQPARHRLRRSDRPLRQRMPEVWGDPLPRVPSRENWCASRPYRADSRQLGRAALAAPGTVAPVAPMGRIPRQLGPAQSPRPGSASEQLGDLHRVERGALAQVVVRHEERQPMRHRRVTTDAPDEARVLAGGLQRCRDVGQLDARRRRAGSRSPRWVRSHDRTRR